MAQGAATPADPGTGDGLTPAAPAAPAGGGLSGARARAAAAIAASGAPPIQGAPPAAAVATPAAEAPPVVPGEPPPAAAKPKEGDIAADPDLIARMARLSEENRTLKAAAKAATQTPEVAARAERMGKIEGMIKSGDRLGALKLLEVSYMDITRDHLAQEPGTEAAEATAAAEAKLDEMGKRIDKITEERTKEKDAETAAAARATQERIAGALKDIVGKDTKRFHFVAKPSQFNRALDAALTHARTKGGEKREALGRPLTDVEAEALVMDGFDAHEKLLRADFGEPAPARAGTGIEQSLGTGVQRGDGEIKHTDSRTAKKRALDAVLRLNGN